MKCELQWLHFRKIENWDMAAFVRPAIPILSEEYLKFLALKKRKASCGFAPKLKI